MSSFYIYAELLLNVRSVTVFISVPTICTIDTQVSMRSDCRTLNVQHDGKTATSCLPCIVTHHGNIAYSRSQTKEISFRLQPSSCSRESALDYQASTSETLWSAAMLSVSSRISCQSCKVILAKPITTWKDLPSSGWADMMDLWHCHKPDPFDDRHGPTEDFESTKGYAASNMLGPRESVGLVGITDFWLSESDCAGIRVSRSQDFLFVRYTFLSVFSWVLRRRPAPRTIWISGKVADAKTLEDSYSHTLIPLTILRTECVMGCSGLLSDALPMYFIELFSRLLGCAR